MTENVPLRPGRVALFGIVLAAASVDLATKAVAEAFLPGTTIPVLPFLSFDLHYNRGVSFSMFQANTGFGMAVLLLVQAVGTTVMTWWMLVARSAIERVGLALIAGGALANLLDRKDDGAVTDFLVLHPFGWGLFTSNVADKFISVGVLLLLADAVHRVLLPRAGAATHVDAAREDARL